MSLYAYRAMERGDDPDFPAPKVSLGTLRPEEQCFVLRRRKGARQRDIARQMGVCRTTVYNMELGLAPVAPLVAYWDRAA